ncbi:uncharacterized protein LOC143294630 [Babylonia areolata]|uniref:uncharacterized protein LOC143294630 n=1 Tax=Babylonia areolata TaxID=304850 RepID=UPI003FD33EBE
MAVVLTSSEGFVLDHDQAITSAYRHCNLLPTFSSSPHLYMSEDKGDEPHQAQGVSESWNVCSGTVFQNSRPLTSKAVHSSETSCVGDGSDDSIVSEHNTAAAKDFSALAQSSALDSVGHIYSVPKHFAQSTADTSLSEQPVSLSTVQHCDELELRVTDSLNRNSVSSDTKTVCAGRCIRYPDHPCKSHSVTSLAEKHCCFESSYESNQVLVTHDESADQKEISKMDCCLSDSHINSNDSFCRGSKCTCKFMTDNSGEARNGTKMRETLSENRHNQVKHLDSNKQKSEMVNSCPVIGEHFDERALCYRTSDAQERESTVCKNFEEKYNRETKYKISCTLSRADTDCYQSASPRCSKMKRLSLRLKQGFFAIKLPFMMDSQFEKVIGLVTQDQGSEAEEKLHIDVANIQQVIQCNQRKRKREKKTRSAEEERLHKVHASLVESARERGIFLKRIPLPLDNNLLSRQHAQLDHQTDVFSPLLLTADGAPLLHMGDTLKPLVVSGADSMAFCAADIIHRRVCHNSTEASVVDVEGTSFVLPPRSQFLVSNLQDFCDHLWLELDEDGYDLIVLDPPWENKSVKRKKSYNMMNEDGLQNLPVADLSRPGGVVAVWVTNNQRLEDYTLDTLFPLWGVGLLARWHWLKVTQTGEMISGMEGHKKPYEVLLLGRSAAGGRPTEEAGKEVPESRVIMSVPCSLHSKKPPLADVLQQYLPAAPRCLELFARNLWPGWTSWGREVLKHQNMIFYEVVNNTH